MNSNEDANSQRTNNLDAGQRQAAWWNYSPAMGQRLPYILKCNNDTRKLCEIIKASVAIHSFIADSTS